MNQNVTINTNQQGIEGLSASVTLMLVKIELAIVAHKAYADLERTAKDRYWERLGAWKVSRGYEVYQKVEMYTPEWAAMRNACGAEYDAWGRAEKNTANARRRLRTATGKRYPVIGLEETHLDHDEDCEWYGLCTPEEAGCACLDYQS